MIGEDAPREPDFKLFGIDRDAPGDRLGLEIISKSATKDGKTRLRCIASSSVEDRHGDTMTEACVRGMAKQATGLTIFLNHKYNFPEDVFGVVESARAKTDADVVLLMLTIIADEASNDRVAKTIAQIENGVRAGVSIGAMLTDYEVKEGHENDWWPPYVINAVDLLEASIVGIPANPKSWVEQVIKTFDRKGIRRRGEATASLDDLATEVASVKLASSEPSQYPDPIQDPDGPEAIAAHYLEQVEAGEWGNKDLESRLTMAVEHSVAWAIDHGDPTEFDKDSVSDIVQLILTQRAAPVASATKSSQPAAEAAETPAVEATAADDDPEDALEALDQESGSGAANEGAVEATADADDQLAQLAEVGVLSSLSDLTDVLKDTLIALNQARAGQASAEAERDLLAGQLGSANATVEAAVKLVKTLMELPAGRKTQMQQAVAESGIASRLKGSVYSEEVLSLMEKGDTLS